MKIELIKYIVNSEVDFIENEVDKIKVDISVVCSLVGANNTNEISLPLTVINDNSQTGDQMDTQRMNEVLNLINTY
jgi:hypothetical protein